MQYRLITLFKVMTATAVITALAIAFASYVYPQVARIHGPPLLVWGRFFAVWGSIVGGVFLFLWWGIKGKANDAWIH